MTDDHHGSGSGEHDDLDNESFRAFFELQKAEVQARLAEIKAGSEDLQNQKEIALRTIEAQQIDRRETRETFERDSKQRKRTALYVLILLIGFFLALVWLDQADMAQKIIEVAVYAVLGAFGGYGYAVSKFKQDDEE